MYPPVLVATFECFLSPRMLPGGQVHPFWLALEKKAKKGTFWRAQRACAVSCIGTAPVNTRCRSKADLNAVVSATDQTKFQSDCKRQISRAAASWAVIWRIWRYLIFAYDRCWSKSDSTPSLLWLIHEPMSIISVKKTNACWFIFAFCKIFYLINVYAVHYSFNTHYFYIFKVDHSIFSR